jgi:DNA modification methylase
MAKKMILTKKDEPKIFEKSRFRYEKGDSADVLKSYGDGVFDLVITSPPYNVGKEYETTTSIEKYLKQQEEIIKEIVRVTNPNGSICWQVGNFIGKNKEIFPIITFSNLLDCNLGIE